MQPSYYNPNNQPYHNQVQYNRRPLTPEERAEALENLKKVGNCACKCFECMGDTVCSPCFAIVEVFALPFKLMFLPFKILGAIANFDPNRFLRNQNRD